MTEPVSGTAIAVTAGGITILGVVTGLQPELLLAGAAGGWWAQIYVKKVSAMARINRVMLASVIAAWASPPVIAFMAGKEWLPTLLPAIAWQLLAALGIGLIAIDALGRGMISAVRDLAGALVRRLTGKQSTEADK